MRVAISGASGMLGKRLSEYYAAQGAIVHALSRCSTPDTENVHWFCQDIAACRDEDLDNFVAGCEVIFHCAAELRDPLRMMNVNFEGTRKLFAAACRAGVKRWVQLSSVGVYGRIRAGMVTEDTPLCPHNPYERSKARADEWLQDEGQQRNIEIVVLRPSNVFAPDMSNQSLTGLVRAIAQGWFFFIGSRSAVMNYVYADDVVVALARCGEHPAAAGQTFIVSEYMPMTELTGIVATRFCRSFPRLTVPESIVRMIAMVFCWMPSFPLSLSRIDVLTSRTIYSQEKIKQKLDYQPSYGIRQGFVNFVDSLENSERGVP